MIEQLRIGLCDMCGARYDIRIEHKCDPKLCCGEWEEVKPDGTRIFHKECKAEWDAERAKEEAERLEAEKTLLP